MKFGENTIGQMYAKYGAPSKNMQSLFFRKILIKNRQTLFLFLYSSNIFYKSAFSQGDIFYYIISFCYFIEVKFKLWLCCLFKTTLLNNNVFGLKFMFMKYFRIFICNLIYSII